MQLQGKKALVLGASRGVGLAIAKSLAQEGVRLALPWYDWPESSQEMMDIFIREGGEHLAMRVDLRRPDDVATLMTQIDEQFQCLDILINNIERGGMPILHGGYHRQINREQWQREMETTLHAKWLVFDQALPLLKKSNEAAVVNISSIAGITGRSGPAGLLFNDGYSAANRGASALTETWARAGAPHIRVNELMLGLVDQRHGPGTKGWSLLSVEEQGALMAHTLLGRTGTPEEVARAVLFLVRDAGFMTGACLRLDGGFVLGGDAAADIPAGHL